MKPTMNLRRQLWMQANTVSNLHKPAEVQVLNTLQNTQFSLTSPSRQLQDRRKSWGYWLHLKDSFYMRFKTADGTVIFWLWRNWLLNRKRLASLWEKSQILSRSEGVTVHLKRPWFWHSTVSTVTAKAWRGPGKIGLYLPLDWHMISELIWSTRHYASLDGLHVSLHLYRIWEGSAILPLTIQ